MLLLLQLSARVFFSFAVMEPSPLLLRAFIGPLYQPWVIVEQLVEKLIGGETEVLGKTCPIINILCWSDINMVGIYVNFSVMLQTSRDGKLQMNMLKEVISDCSQSKLTVALVGNSLVFYSDCNYEVLIYCFR